MIRNVINFVIAFFWLAIFQLAGLVDVQYSVVESHPTLSWLLVTALGAFVFGVVFAIGGAIWKFVARRVKPGCILFVIWFSGLAYFVFRTAHYLNSELFRLPENVWLLILMSFVIGILRIPTVAVAYLTIKRTVTIHTR